MKLSPITLLFLLLLTLNKSVSAQTEKEEKIKFAPNPEMIPPDFDPNKHVLLVMWLP